MFKQIDLTALVTALGVALPAIIAATRSTLNARTLKTNAKKIDDAAALARTAVNTAESAKKEILTAINGGENNAKA